MLLLRWPRLMTCPSNIGLRFMNSPTESLVRYVEQQIIPQYNMFDRAHGIEHVRMVIRQSLALATYYEVDIDMVYTIAAYHDTGLAFGREQHHIVAGRILAADTMLSNWFSAEQIATMCEAVEDHRASSTHAPRSIYGRIVAEADRCIVPEQIIRRTIQYGLAHYPHLDRAEQYGRMVDHLLEKYAEGGYLQLWIPESDNSRQLAELRLLINDRPALKALFDRLFDKEIALSAAH